MHLRSLHGIPCVRKSDCLSINYTTILICQGIIFMLSVHPILVDPQWRTKELGTEWKSTSKLLLRRTLLLTTIFFSGLGSPHQPPPPPPAVLFGVGGKGSLVLLISLERSHGVFHLSRQTVGG